MTRDSDLPTDHPTPGSARGRWKRGRTARRWGAWKEGAKAAPRPPALLFEALEPRVLLSADPALLATTALTRVQAYDAAPAASPAANAAPADAPADPSPPITGSIDVPGQVNLYKFTLASPSSLYFDSLTGDNSITWTLNGPRGAEVSARAFGSSDGPNVQSPLLLPAGDYTLQIAGQGTHTGSYGFRLLDLGTAPALATDTTVTGTLAQGNEATAYSFTGTAGERVFLDAQSGSGLYWHVLDQYGQTVGNSASYFSDAQLVLPSNGSYTLVLEGSNDATTAAAPYSFAVDVDTDTSTPLTIGATVSAAVTLPGQQNAFTFTLAAETRVSFDSLTPDGSLHWSLAGPGGTVVNTRNFTGSDGTGLGATNLLDLAPGSYTLTVGASGDHVGSYGFRLLDLSAATAVGTGTAVTGTLGDAGLTAGATAPGRASQAFAFNATRGDQVTLTAPTANYAIYYHLYDPSGREVAEDYLRTGGTQILLLTGAYTLVLEGNVGNTTPEAYGFSLVNSGNAPPAPFTGTATSLGSTVSKTVAAAGEVDDYVFSTTAPARVLFQPTSLASSTTWSLDGPRGNEANNQSFYSSTVLSLPVAGTYRLRFTNGTAGQTFGLQLLDLSAATATTPGAAVSGTLTPSTSASAYQFSGTAGDALYFDTPSGGNGNLRWQLLDPLGQSVFSQGFSAAGRITLGVTGSFTLIVSGQYYAPAAAQSYTFQIDREGDTTAALTLGTAVAGTLTEPGQLANYTFTLAAPATVYMNALDTTSGPTWTLVGPRGTEVNAAQLYSYYGNGGDRVLTLPAGSYTLTVAGTPAAYAFNLINLASAAPLALGTTVTEANPAPHAAQLYSFTGAVGDRVLLDVLSNSDGNLQYRIVDPYGRDFQATTGLSSSGVLTLPYAGTYTLIVFDTYFDGSATASYSLSLQRVTDTTQAVTPGGTAETGPLSVPGVIGSALDFTGTEYATAADPSLDLRSTVTVEFWLNPQKVENTWSALVYKGDNVSTNDNSRSYSVWLNASGYIMLSTQDASGDHEIQTGYNSVPFGQWTHVAAVMDRVSGTLAIYLNGVLAVSGTVPTTPANGSAAQPLRIGLSTEDGNQYGTDASLDDLRIYDRALSASEIAAGTTTPVVSPGADLALYLRMDDASGAATLADSSTHALTVNVVRPDAGLPGTITDRIANPGQTRRYTFTLTQATTLVFDGLTDNSAITVTLTGPGGLSVTRNLRNGDGLPFGSGNPAIAAPAGSYTIAVTESGTGTDPFAFRFVDLAGATPITLGTPVTGTLADGAATAAYSFAATAGERIYLQALSQSQGYYNLSFRLIDPSGNQVTGPISFADIGDTTLALAGTYTLLVEGGTYNARPGSFSFVVYPVVDQQVALTLGTNPDPGPQGAPGKFGDGVRLSGADTVTVPDSPALDLTGDVTIEAWVDVDRMPSTWTALVYKGDGPLDGQGRTYSLWLRYDGSVYLSTSRGTGGEEALTSPAGLVMPGSFHHIAGIIDRTNGMMHLYVDGLDVADTGLDPTLAHLSAEPLVIGGTTEADGSYSDFQGTIDDVRVWSGARTGAQVAADMAAPLAAPQAGLALYLPFDEAGGGTAADGSGNGAVATVRRGNAAGVTGRITSPGQQVVYSFTLASVAELYFDSLTDENGFNWSLTGPDGTVVAGHPLNSSDANRGTYLLGLQPGQYKLSISGSAATTGGFNFRLLDLLTAAPIVPGTATAVTLTPGSAAQAFSFTGTAGERVLFDATGVAGGNAIVRVIDPAGHDLFGAVYAGNLAGLGVQTLAQAGTYTVIADADVFNDPGLTTLTLLVQPVSDKAAALVPGTEVDGSIDVPGQTARYGFTLAGAATLIFDSLTNDNSLDWTLTGPDGTIVTSRAFSQSDSYDGNSVLTLAAGAYTLAVTGSGDHTGAFAFNLLDVSAAPVLVAGSTLPLTVPARATSTVRFAGQAGDRVSLVPAGASGGATLRVLAPDGSVLLGPVGIGTDPASLTLSQTGSYTIVVENRVSDPNPSSVTLLVVPLDAPAANGAVQAAVPANDATPVDLGLFAAGTYHIAAGGLVSLVGNANDPNALVMRPDGTPAVPVTRSGFTYLNPSGSPVNVPDGNLYGPGGTGANLGALLGTLTATPASPSDYFVIGNGRDVTLAAAGHIYALVNDTYYSDNEYDYAVTVTPAAVATGAITQGFAGGGIPYALSNYNGTPARVLTDGTGTFLRLTDASGSYQNNSVEFSSTAAGPYDSVTAGFDFRIAPGGTRGLGVGAVLLNTSAWGNSGPSTAFDNLPEVASGLAVKLFATNDGSDDTVALTWNGTTITTAAAGFDLGSGAWDHAQIVVTRTDGGALVSVVLTANGGTATTVINGAFVGGYQLATSRLSLFGSTDYRTQSADVRAVSVTATAAAALPALTIGTTQSGTVATAGAVERYTLTVAAATDVVFDGLSTDGNFNWSLEGSGQAVEGRSFYSSDSADFSADPVLHLLPGTYQFAVARSSGTGSFAFRLLDLAAATPLTLGTAVTGTLDPGNSTAAYSFTVTAGEQVEIASLSGWNGSQYYRLLGPGGVQAVAPTPLYQAFGPLTLQTPGTYTLLMEGRYYQSSASQYGFTVSAVTNVAKALTLGTDVTGTLSSPGGTVTYSFTLASPTVLYLHSESGDYDLHYALAGPDGLTLASGVFGSGDTTPIIAGAGTYTLTVASDNADGHTGPFGFNLLDLGASTIPALTPGTPVSAALALPNGIAAYAVTVSAGARVSFVTPSAGSGLSWELVDSQGSVVFGPTGIVSQDQRTLALGGRYVLLITGYPTRTGDASYTVAAVPASDSTAALVPGAATSGSIASAGATNSFTFTLAAPTDVLLAALADTLDSGYAYGSSLHWTLTGPGGVVASHAFNSSNGTEYGSGSPLLALAAGSYTLTFSAAAGQTGTYQFRLLNLAAATPLTLGQPVPGALAPGSDTAAYSFSGTAGEAVFVAVNSFSGGSAVYRITGANGAAVYYGYAGSSPGQVTLPSTQTYYLTLEGYLGDAVSTVSYGFTAFANAPATPIPIGPGAVQAPDLQVQGLSATAAGGLQSGAAVTVSWTDANTGTLPTDAAWTDRVIIRRSDTQEILATTTLDYTGAALAAGGTAARSVVLTLPDGARGAGALVVAVTTDIGNTVSEQNAAGTGFSNNTATLPVTSALAPYPDLQVSNVALTPASGFAPGDTVVASWTVANAGTAATPAGFAEQIRIKNLLTGDTVVLLSDTAAALAAGASTARSLSFAWPSGYDSTGTFEMDVTADPSGAVVEAQPPGSRTDNTGTLTLRSAPDLAISGLAVGNTAALQSGDTVTVGWTEANNGNAPTSVGWTDHVHVVNTTTGAVVLDQDVAAAALAVGASRTPSVSFKLPDGAAGAGTLQITVTLDSGGAVLEAVPTGNARDNDAQTISATSTLRVYPDLKVATTVPATGTGGSAVTLSWTVTNAGAGATAAGSWTDKVVLTTTPTLGAASDVVLGTFTHTGNLAPNGAYTQSQSVTLPSELQGTYYVFVVADSGGAVLEPNTRADSTSAASAVAITSPYAALGVSAVTAPAAASAGGSVTVGWTVTNGGTGATDVASWQDKVYLSTGTTPQAGDVLLGTVTHVGALAVGGSYNGTLVATLPAAISGTYHVLVVTDAGGAVYQDGHTAGNAGSSGPVVVSNAAFTVAVTAPAGVEPGGGASISWTVTDSGAGDAAGSWTDRVYVSADGSLADAVALADVPHGGGLPKGQSYSASANVTLPGGLADGTATIFVVADVGHQVTTAGATGSATTAVTHADLLVSGVSAPASATAGSSLTLTWSVGDVGTADTGTGWTDTVFLAPGTTLDGAIQLGTVAEAAETAGQTRTASAAVTLPLDLAAGVYHFLVQADRAGQVLQGGRTANDLAASASVPVTAASLPNLRVTGLTLSPTGSVASGSVLGVRWITSNTGTAPASGAFYDRVKVVNTTTGQTLSDTVVGYDPSTSGAIPAGTGMARSTSVRLPDGAAAVGTLAVTVTADTFNQVVEGTAGSPAEADNAATTTITGTLAAYADLQVSGITLAPRGGTSGQPLAVNWTTANTGAAAVATAFSERVQVINQTTGQVIADTTVRYDPAGSGAIAGGGSVARTATVTLPDGPASVGQLLVRVTTDSQSEIFEYNATGTAETNNVAAVTTTGVLGAYPDLVVGNVVAPATAFAGQAVTVTWTESNNGTAAATGTWSDVITFASGGGAPVALLTVTETGQSIAPGASVARSATVTLPANVQGSGTLAVIANATGAFYEVITSNNTAAAAPTAIAPGLTVTLGGATIAENAGAAALQVTVARSGSTAQALTVTLAADPTALTVPATITIPAGQAGITLTAGAVDDGLVTGTRQATITASSLGFGPGSATVAETEVDQPALALAMPANVSESDGSATATLTRNTPTDTALTVALQTDNADKLVPPATVTIPAGQASVTVPIAILNDGFAEGNRTVHLIATAAGFVNGSAQVSVKDTNVPNLTLSLGQSVVSEAAGPNATTLTVTRDTVSTQDIEVSVSTDISQVRLPARITIPAGSLSASVPVAVADLDQPISGSRVVAIDVSVADAVLRIPIVGTTVRTLLQINGSVGPQLAISLNSTTLAAGTATTGTVTRIATDTSTPLTVTLSSSDLTEASVTPTVTIAAGQTSASFAVSGLNDGQPAALHNVTLVASAAGLIDGAAQVTVTNRNLPDLAVTSIQVPDNVVAGQSFTVSYTVTNTGLITATAPFTDRVLLSTDVVLTADDTLVATVAGETLAPGASYTKTVTLTAPNVPGSLYVLVQTNAALDVQELGTGNNLRTSDTAVTINPSYRATVAASTHAAPSGTSITLSGTAYDATTGAFAPSKLISVQVMTAGTTRELLGVTDDSGHYSVVFKPLSTEAGDYTVAAAEPGVVNRLTQDSFSLEGIKAVTSGIAVTTTPNTAVTGSFVLQNLSSVPLTGLTASVAGLPATATLTISPIGDIAANGSATLSYSFTSSQPIVGNAPLVIRSAEGVVTSVPFALNVLPLRPQLVANPGSLDRGMVRGTTTLVSFEIDNTGGADSGALAVALPSLPWLSLVSPASIGSIAPGGHAIVTIQLAPGADLPLDEYQGAIVVSGANTSLTEAFTFRALSTATGDVSVGVEDEYTYFAADKPLVAGATVTLSDPFTFQVVASGVTDASGHVTFTGVAEGRYAINITADKHDVFNGAVDILPGTTNTFSEFLHRQLVTYNWTVVPTAIPDHYQIVLQSTFETAVPAPVVTIDQPLIVPLVLPGQVTETDITLTNHGLIDATNVRLTLPTSDNFDITSLISSVPVLPAMSSITIPILISFKPGVAESAASTASIAGGAATAQSLSALGGSTAVGVSDLKGVLSECLGIDIKYDYICRNEQTQDLKAIVDFLGCVKDTKGFAGSALKAAAEKSGGNLVNAGCDLITAALSCFGIELSACQQALLSSACGGIVGALEGGPAGAAAGVAGAWSDILACLCSLGQGDGAGGGATNPVDEGGGGFGGGGGGYGSPGTPYDVPVSYTVPSPCGDGPGPAAAGTANAQIAAAADAAAQAQDNSVCATVRLQITQQAVITRTAFTGTLDLDDGAAVPLTGVTVTLDIHDSDGNAADDKFVIRDPTVLGFTANGDGTFTLAAGVDGKLQYVFVPTQDAAVDDMTSYEIGGTLQYMQDGSLITVQLSPAKINVYPEARLQLDYFYQRDVIGDDPFTPDVVEPSEPFHLGLEVTNIGKGDAQDLTITSAQPQIIENEKGLLVNFQIIGSQVGADTVTPSLTVDLGSIAPGQTTTADFTLLSTLQGKFENFSATYTHEDDKGDLRTSLISSVTVHELIRQVQVTTPTDDGIPDYLVNDIPDANHDPDTLYLSTGGQAPVSLATGIAVANAGALTETLTATQAGGWSYISVADPAPGLKLVSVTRSDGKVIPLDGMVWRTTRTFPADAPEPIDENLLHLLDYDGTGSYTLVFVSDDHTPPHIQSISGFDGVQVLPPDAVDVQLSKEIEDDTFTAAALTLTHDGAVVKLSGLTITDAGSGLFHISGLAAFTGGNGDYQLTVDGTQLADAAGNHGDNQASTSFAVSTDGTAVLTGLSPVTPAIRNTGVESVDATFSAPVTLTTAGVTLTRDGTPVALGSSVTVVQLSPTTYRIGGLGSFTAAAGSYVLTVDGRTAQDASAHAAAGVLSDSWTVDLTAPAVTAIEQITTNPRNTIVPSLIVTVSEPIDPASFDWHAVTITKDGGPNLATSAITVTPIDATHFQLMHFNDHFDAATGIDGTYTITVNGATLRDLAGNAGTGSVTESWTIDVSGPNAPSALAVAPDTGASSTDGLVDTLSLTVTGTVDPGVTVRLTDMTNGTELGYATVTGSTFTANVTLPGPGTHHLRARAVDDAGNTADSFIDVFADTTPPTVTALSAVTPSPRTTPVNSVQVTFSEDVDPATFTPGAVQLTRDGVTVAVPGATVTSLGHDVWSVAGLTPYTSATGAYVLSFTGAIKDLAGNALVDTVTDGWTVATAVSTGFGGFVYEDANGDGVRAFGPSVPSYDTQEEGLAGWTVFIDANGNGVLDTGELSAVTGSDGSYSFKTLAPGTYTVAVAPQAGYTGIAPAGGSTTVTVGADQFLATSYDFGEFKLGTLSGVVFNDANGNGALDTGEGPLAGWTVFLDEHGDNVLHADDPSVVTGADGAFSFSGIGPGVTRIGEVAQAGYGRTTAETAITVESGYLGHDLDIGDTQLATITGNVFDDVTGSGVRLPTDAGLQGWTVFVDSNNDGQLETNEQSVLTDANGNYSLTGLLPGRYSVRVIEPDGWQETTPAAPGAGSSSDGTESLSTSGLGTSGLGGMSSAPIEIDCTCGGTWSVQGGVDLGAQSVADAASLTALTQARTDARFAGLLGQGQTTVVIDTGIDNSHPFFGPETIVPGRADRIVYEYDFADGTADATDTNGHGSNIASLIGSSDGTYTGVAPDTNLIVLKVFDNSGHGYFSYVQQALDWVLANVDKYNISVVNMSLGDGGNWTDDASRYGLGGVLGALATKDVITVAAAGNNYAQFNSLGVAYPASDPAVLAVGSVWSGDFGGPWRVSTGAVDYTTGADHIAAYSQRDPNLLDTLAPGSRFNGANATGGVTTMQGTSQAAAYVSGAATLAQELAKQVLGRYLTTGEFAALLRATGDMVVDGAQNNDNVRNTGLSFPRLDFVKLFDAIEAYSGSPASLPSVAGTGGVGRVATAAVGAGFYTVTVTAGQVAGGNDFGEFRQASVSGTVFNDAGGDGTQDTGDAGVSGRTVFVDTAGTGALADGDPRTSTDGTGAYSFTGLGPGSYVVREVLKAGTVATTAVTPVVATSGLAAVRSFGEFTLGRISGAIFDDADRNGTRGRTEGGLSGRTVYLDLDNSGTLTPGDTVALTDGRGGFSFTSLPAGTYTVREVVPDGRIATTASPHVTVVSGTSASVSLGEAAHLATITGVLFADANGDGIRESGEGGLLGRTVYLDLAGAGTFVSGDPVTTTLRDGSFHFDGVAPGAYTVAEMLAGGHAATTGTVTAAVTSGETASVLLGEWTPATVTGVLFDDTDDDGAREAGEPGLPGRTVFLDVAGTGLMQAGDPSTLTLRDGSFTLHGLPPGSYTVREALTGTEVTSTVPATVTLAPGSSATVTLGEWQPPAPAMAAAASSQIVSLAALPGGSFAPVATAPGRGGGGGGPIVGEASSSAWWAQDAPASAEAVPAVQASTAKVDLGRMFTDFGWDDGVGTEWQTDAVSGRTRPSALRIRVPA